MIIFLFQLSIIYILRFYNIEADFNFGWIRSTLQNCYDVLKVNVKYLPYRAQWNLKTIFNSCNQFCIYKKTFLFIGYNYDFYACVYLLLELKKIYRKIWFADGKNQLYEWISPKSTILSGLYRLNWIEIVGKQTISIVDF